MGIDKAIEALNILKESFVELNTENQKLDDRVKYLEYHLTKEKNKNKEFGDQLITLINERFIDND